MPVLVAAPDDLSPIGLPGISADAIGKEPTDTEVNIIIITNTEITSLRI